MTEPQPAADRKTTWKADSTHPQLAASLRETWSEVMDPELALSIIQLGLIREVEIREDSALIRMILTTPFCPYGPALMENARLKAVKVLDLPATMELGAEAWDPSMMEDDAASEWGLLY
jgi:metal-sulfur cluster biosynthetic enzyme